MGFFKACTFTRLRLNIVRCFPVLHFSKKIHTRCISVWETGRIYHSGPLQISEIPSRGNEPSSTLHLSRCDACPLEGHRSYRTPGRGSNKGRSGGSARKLGGGRSHYPLFCPSSAKGGSAMPSSHETPTSPRSPALSRQKGSGKQTV